MIQNCGRLGYDFLVFDGVNLSDSFVVRSFSKPWLPNIDVNTLAVDGHPGEYYVSRRIGTRDVTVGLGLLSATSSRTEIEKRWTELSRLINKDDVCKLEIGNGRYMYAMMVGESPVTVKGRWSIVEITFRCFDPYIYGEEHTETLKTGNNTIRVHGDVPTYPLITITGAQTTTVTNNATGDKTRVEGLVASQTLEVDMEQHVCRVGATYKPADPTISDFWTIDPGDVTINLSSGTGTLTYKERYL